MPKFKKLHANQGSDEANHGTERYRVDNDGNITVPEEAAPDLIKMGGFTEVDPETPEVPDGHVTVAHDDATGCSWGGQSFDAQDDGTFRVPAGAVADLVHHGFRAVERTEPTPKKADGKIPQLKLSK